MGVLERYSPFPGSMRVFFIDLILYTRSVKVLSEKTLVEFGVSAHLPWCLISNALKSSVTLLLCVRDLFLRELMVHLKRFGKLWECKL